MNQPKGALTIHLYRRDEALASLRWAIITHNYTETAFWGLELYDSNMEEDVIEMLTTLWISQIGLGSLAALESLSFYIEERLDWIHRLICWTRIKVHDTTAFYLLLRGTCEPLDWKPNFPHSKRYMNIESAFEDTLKRGKIVETWLLGRAMTPLDQWSSLEQILIDKGREKILHIITSSRLTDYQQRVVLLVYGHATPEVWAHANASLDMRPLPDELLESINQWDSENSLRRRRLLSPRPEAIHFITERSTMPTSESTDSEITEFLEQTLLASPYWSSVLKFYHTGHEWISDDKKEAFYDLYFQHDIPDEWSLADREKSHGRGLGRSVELGQKRFLETIFQKSKILGIWVQPNTIQFNIQSNLDTFYETCYSKCIEFMVSHFPLEPVGRAFDLTLLNTVEYLTSVLSGTESQSYQSLRPQGVHMSSHIDVQE
jgi:hypothetical protein